MSTTSTRPSAVLKPAIEYAGSKKHAWIIKKMTPRERLVSLASMAAPAGARPDLRPLSQEAHLAFAARLAVQWAADVSVPTATEEGIWLGVRHEYDRAHDKHSGHTPFHPGMTDDDRTFILLEEVGEVARALTPDATTAIGHAGELADELIQVATMATAWLARILADRSGGNA